VCRLARLSSTVRQQEGSTPLHSIPCTPCRSSNSPVVQQALIWLHRPQAAVPFSRLLKLNKPELPWAVVGCIASGVLGAQMPAFAIALSSIINVYYLPPSEIPSQAAKWAGIFVAIGVGTLLASLVQQGCFSLMGAKLARRVRMLTLQSLMRQVTTADHPVPPPRCPHSSPAALPCSGLPQSSAAAPLELRGCGQKAAPAGRLSDYASQGLSSAAIKLLAPMATAPKSLFVIVCLFFISPKVASKIVECNVAARCAGAGVVRGG